MCFAILSSWAEKKPALYTETSICELSIFDGTPSVKSDFGGGGGVEGWWGDYPFGTFTFLQIRLQSSLTIFYPVSYVHIFSILFPVSSTVYQFKI
jgi:hypothetical protein